jgi:hypothetical protein
MDPGVNGAGSGVNFTGVVAIDIAPLTLNPRVAVDATTGLVNIAV